MFTFISELVDMAVKKKDLTDELARAGVESEQLIAGVKERLENAFRGAAATGAGGRRGAPRHQPDRCHGPGDGDMHGR